MQGEGFPSYLPRLTDPVLSPAFLLTLRQLKLSRLLVAGALPALSLPRDRFVPQLCTLNLPLGVCL